MGNTYSQRREVEVALRQKDHLRFILDNFHMRNNCLNIKTVKYIIAAFTMDEEVENDCTALDDLQSSIITVRHSLLNNHKKIGHRMQGIKEMVFNMIRRHDIGEQ